MSLVEHSRSFSFTDKALVETVGDRQFIYGRWGRGFGVWYRHAPAMAARRAIPEWPLFDDDGSLTFYYDAIREDLSCARHYFPGEDEGAELGDDIRYDADELAEAFGELMGEIPRSVRAAVAPLGPYQWRALDAVSRNPRIRDWIEPGRPVNEVLLATACWCVTREQDREPGLAEMVDQTIAGGRARGFLRDWFSEAGAEIAGAIARMDENVWLVREVITSLTNIARASRRRIRLCTYLPRITHAVAEYVELARPEFLHPRVAIAMAELSGEQQSVEQRQYSDFLGLELRQVRGGDAERIAELLRSVKDVDSLRNAVRRARSVLFDLRFPEPPLGSRPPLFPLTTAEQLIAEGATMRHCAKTYAGSVAEGRVYFYHWTGEPAATMVLSARDGKWCFHEVRGVDNQDVPVDTLCQILNCLEPAASTGTAPMGRERLRQWRPTREWSTPRPSIRVDVSCPRHSLQDRRMAFDKAKAIIDLALRMQGTAEGVSLEEIRAEFGVSRRTAERMRDAVDEIFGGLDPVDTGEQTKRWRLESPKLAGLTFVDREELAAVEAARRLLDQAGRGDEARALAGLSRKLRATMPRKRLRRVDPDLELLTEAEGLAARPGPRPTTDPDLLADLRHAILAGRRIRIRYRGQVSGEEAWHKLCPYGLLYGVRPYLVAFSLNPQVFDYHLFRLSNILEVEMTEEPFERRPDFSLSDFAKRSFGVFQEEPFDVVWRFKPEVAEEARQWQFHPDQKFENRPDGSLIVRFRAGGALEMDWHLYTWGNGVEVLSPPDWEARVGRS